MKKIAIFPITNIITYVPIYFFLVYNVCFPNLSFDTMEIARIVFSFCGFIFSTLYFYLNKESISSNIKPNIENTLKN